MILCNADCSASSVGGTRRRRPQPQQQRRRATDGPGMLYVGLGVNKDSVDISFCEARRNAAPRRHIWELSLSGWSGDQSGAAFARHAGRGTWRRRRRTCSCSNTIGTARGSETSRARCRCGGAGTAAAARRAALCRCRWQCRRPSRPGQAGRAGRASACGARRSWLLAHGCYRHMKSGSEWAEYWCRLRAPRHGFKTAAGTVQDSIVRVGPAASA